MNKQEILEYNKRCAEFLGYQVMTEESFLMYEYPKGTDLSKVWVDTALVFHSDWNWIMEVLQKILAITFSDSEEETSDSEIFYLIRDCIPDKEHIVRTINQFLIQYNENTTNETGTYR